MSKKASVSIAKDRLRTLVTSDRVNCSPNMYDLIYHELYQTLSKYIELTPEEFDIVITHTHIHIKFTGEEHCDYSK